MTERRFDGILIDFYGTICAGDREAVEAVCRDVVQTCDLPIGAPELAVTWGECFFAVVDRSNHDSFRNLYECVRVSLVETLDGHQRHSDPDPFVAQLAEYWTDPPVFADALEFIRTNDLPICCLSNADTVPLLEAIQKHGLRFDAVVSSEDARSYKPNRAIFEQGLNALGIEPDRAIHVGDSLHADIGGAAGLGITTAWICREDRIHDIGTCKPDFTLSSLGELAPLLRNGHTEAGSAIAG